MELKNVQDQLRNHKTNTCQHTIDPHLPAICLFCGCGLGCDSSFTLGYNNQKNSMQIRWPSSACSPFLHESSVGLGEKCLGGLPFRNFFLSDFFSENAWLFSCSLFACWTGVKLKSYSQFTIGHQSLTCSCRSEHQWHPGHVQNKL